MAKKYWNEEVEFDCEFCGSDDAEAAFWDEFMKGEEQTEMNLDEKAGEYTVRFVDETTGEEWEFEGLTGEREVLKWD